MTALELELDTLEMCLDHVEDKSEPVTVRDLLTVIRRIRELNRCFVRRNPNTGEVVFHQ